MSGLKQFGLFCNIGAMLFWGLGIANNLRSHDAGWFECILVLLISANAVTAADTLLMAIKETSSVR